MPMKRLVVLFTMLFAFSSLAQSEEPRFTAYSKILTYKQLMRLSPAKRVEYVEGVRAMMAEIEAMSAEMAKTDPERAERLNAYLQLMGSVISAADAQPITTGLPEFNSRGRATQCTGQNIIAAQVPGTDLYACRTISVVNRSCPPRFVAVLQKPAGTFVCYTPQSFNSLPAAIRTSLRRPATSPITPQLREVFLKTGPPVAAPRPAAAAAARPVARPAARPAQLQVVLNPPPSDSISSTRQTARASDGEPAPARRRPRQKPAPATAETAAGATEVTPARPAAAPPLDSTAEFEAFTLDACPEVAADPAGLTCSRAEINAAKTRLYSRAGRPPPSCFYAGHVRNYKNNRIAPRNCEPISEFCSESDSCRNALTDQKTTPRFRCGSGTRTTDAGKILCNPLIFGFRRGDQSPYCVSPGANATKSCDELSSTERDEQNNPTRFEWVSGTKGAGMDGAAMAAIGLSLQEKATGFHELWDQFAASINNMCVDDRDLRQVFCQECAVVRRRAITMNMQAVPGEALRICTKLFEFSRNPQVKLEGEKDTGSIEAPPPPLPPPGQPVAAASLTAAPGAVVVVDPALSAGPTADPMAAAAPGTTATGTGAR